MLNKYEGVNERSGKLTCRRNISFLPEELSVTKLGDRNSGNDCGIRKQKHRGICGKCFVGF